MVKDPLMSITEQFWHLGLSLLLSASEPSFNFTHTKDSWENIAGVKNIWATKHGS